MSRMINWITMYHYVRNVYFLFNGNLYTPISAYGFVHILLCFYHYGFSCFSFISFVGQLEEIIPFVDNLHHLVTFISKSYKRSSLFFVLFNLIFDSFVSR